MTDLDKSNLANFLGVKLVPSPGKYLGVTFKLRGGRTADFQDLLDKVSNKLQGWKAKLLSQAGRLTLINSVLNSIPIYTFSVFKAPHSICNKLDSIVNAFWWGHDPGHKKLHLTNWDTLTSPRQERGLGIRKFKLMNIALLAKQYWRICNNPNLLLTKTLKAKLGAHTLLHNQVTKVADLINQADATWKADTVRQLYDKNTADLILDQTQALNAPRPGPIPPPKLWKNLWKLKLPNKLLTFTWKLLHHALPVTDVLNHKGHSMCSNMYKQGHQQGNMPLHPPRTRKQIQFPQEWQLIILIANVAAKNKQWQGTAFIGKNRQGEVLFVGCKTLRIAAGTMAKITTIRDASLQASILGIRGCIFLTTSKGLEGMWSSNKQHHWSLQPIFEDIRCIQQHSSLQIHIKAVPKLIIAESISLASQASQHFVNVLHISTPV
uniref:Reverse transcriptase zinc-binding domain-containing protein n=1 Tax=Fagus sylvatica TaxID=28930 RepID=A0A2N9G2E0_FAGSY